MNMNQTRLITTIFAICSLFALSGAALATPKPAHNHHDGRQMLGANLKADGHHDIHKKGHYTASVETRGGKIAALHVKHDTKGDIPVKKYKTHKKMAQAREAHLVYASFQDQYAGTEYVGYSYVDDDGNEEIYWFPYDMVIDGDTGAVEYVPAD